MVVVLYIVFSQCNQIWFVIIIIIIYLFIYLLLLFWETYIHRIQQQQYYMYINEYTYNKIYTSTDKVVQATGDRAIIALATDLVKVRLSLLYILNKRLLLDSDDPMASLVARRENVSLASFPQFP